MDINQKLEEKRNQLEQLKTEIDKLEAEKKQFNAMKPEYKLADILHTKMCRQNHTDGCGWFYESWERIGSSRKSYIEKAKNILTNVEYETAKKVINLL